jgi:hypothetical protein
MFLLLLALFTQDDRKFDLKFDRTPAVGEKSEMSEEFRQTFKMTITAGGKTVKEQSQDEKRTFRAVQVVGKVEGSSWTEATWTFSKAANVVDGKESTYGFEGKTVKVTQKDGVKEFAYEDGAEIPAADLKGLKAAFGSKKGQGGNGWQPKEPVKIGESWTPDIDDLIKSMSDGMTIDAKTAKGTMTLKSVEKREGREFARVTGKIEMEATQLGKLDLEKRLPLVMEVDADFCPDAGVKDGTLKMTFTAKGSSPVSAEGQEFEIELDMKVEAGGVKKALK